MNSNNDSLNLEKDLNKELTTINKAACILKQDISEDSIFTQFCQVIPSALQNPKSAEVCLEFNGNTYSTDLYKETPWKITEEFETINQQKGSITICYQKEFPHDYRGSFSRSEKYLLSNLTYMLVGYINSRMGKKLIENNRKRQGVGYTHSQSMDEGQEEYVYGPRLLQSFLNRHTRERDLFHDLMPYKVKEVLLVSSLYDAYIIEKEGRFSEHMLGRFPSQNMSSLPRITGVSSEEEAIEQLDSRHFDMIIFMIGLDKETPVELSKRIRHEYPYIPIFFLLNNENDLPYFKDIIRDKKIIDNLFVWTGDYHIFFAMIKLIEDDLNIENDTEVGNVRVILLVEDDPIYYSRYLPLLYRIVMDQTKRILEDIDSDQILRILRMKARSKIILARNYTEAIRVLDRYKENMLCLISDVKFERNGIVDEQAGFELVKFAKNKINNLPTIIQSSDTSNYSKAHEHNSTFIDKNSETLLQDFQNFIIHYLGFGDFVFKDAKGKEISRARNLKEFETCINNIPIESLNLHAKQNHLSQWLMARGEVKASKLVSPLNVKDYDDPEEHRKIIINILEAFREHKYKGRVMPFHVSAMHDSTVISRLARGTLGGKGRGIAFINNLINNFHIEEVLPELNIKLPKTYIIGSYEFDRFMEKNNLDEAVVMEDDYISLKKRFTKGKFSKSLIRQLRLLVSNTDKPLAIRSSGIFEDSFNLPFSGIFDTLILPNSHPNREERLDQICEAIKLVYASVFSKKARSYVETVNHKINEEKMSIVIQELVGQQYQNIFLPHISGVAQSYSYYSLPNMKAEDGISSSAVGLGKYIVDGNDVFRFSPSIPDKSIIPKKQLRSQSQKDFYAVDLENISPNLIEGEEASLIKLPIENLADYEEFKECVSTWDEENNTYIPGFRPEGKHIVNFMNILKYSSVTLAKTLKTIMKMLEDAIGTPVEIEYAIDLKRDLTYKPTFYVLQVKPLIGSSETIKIDTDQISGENTLLFSDHIMGNGIVKDIRDVVIVKESAFNIRETQEIAKEIDVFNQELKQEKRNYLLAGPGRWGTRDKLLGIPVNYPMISNAKVIIEYSIPELSGHASMGSHFFHNVTAMKIGYLSVIKSNTQHVFNCDLLSKSHLFKKGKYVELYRFANELDIKLDGFDSKAIIQIPASDISDKSEE
ncbi:MAG: PEP/pyruvate-binding domain-containing protein [Hyphomicrobiales bacterium]